MKREAFFRAVNCAQAILTAESISDTALDRYLSLRSLACHELWPAQSRSRWIESLKSVGRRMLLSPIVSYHDQLLTHMRRELANDIRCGPIKKDIPNLLYIAPFDVLSRNGGAARVLGLARAFSATYDVSILCIVGPKRSLEVIPVAPGVMIYAVPQSHDFCLAVDQDRARYGNAAFSLGLHSYFEELPVLSYWFERLAAKASFVVLNQPYLYRLCQNLPENIPLLYDVPEVNSFFTLRNAASASDPESVKRLQAELETSACRKARVIGMCSPPDIECLVREQGEGIREKIRLIPNGIHVEDAVWMPPGASRRLRKACMLDRPLAVFMGSPGYAPNLEAVQFIARQLALAFPEVMFAVIGMEASDLGPENSPDNVLACGRVTESAKRALISLADVALSPIINYDSGSSLKIAEYVAHGKPVLASEHGLRGYEALHEIIAPVSLETLPSRLGELLQELERQPEALDAPCLAARKKLQEHYDWHAIGQRYMAD